MSVIASTRLATFFRLVDGFIASLSKGKCAKNTFRKLPRSFRVKPKMSHAAKNPAARVDPMERYSQSSIDNAARLRSMADYNVSVNHGLVESSDLANTLSDSCKQAIGVFGHKNSSSGCADGESTGELPTPSCKKIVIPEDRVDGFTYDGAGNFVVTLKNGGW